MCIWFCLYEKNERWYPALLEFEISRRLGKKLMIDKEAKERGRRKVRFEVLNIEVQSLFAALSNRR